MKINPKVREQIVEHLYMLKMGTGTRINTEPNERIRELLRGKLLGLDEAMQVLNSWNLPNHGLYQKVQLNTGKK